MQTHEFTVIMADFAELAQLKVKHKGGLAFDSLQTATLFRDKYYFPHIEGSMRGRDITQYPEFLHFSGHQENLSSILRLLGY